jgi:preprotein translocase subunit SecE
MAVKEKKQDLFQSSRLAKIMATEYKWETYLLGVLSVFALALGLLMVTGTLTIKEDTPIIGAKPIIFEIMILALGVIGLILFAIPFFRPAFPEIKKLTFPTGRLFVANAVRVFIFLLVMVSIFLLYEYFISALLRRLNF